MSELKPHPEQCPQCGSDQVLYERFTRTNGEYVCDDCGWGMDALRQKKIHPADVFDYKEAVHEFWEEHREHNDGVLTEY